MNISKSSRLTAAGIALVAGLVPAARAGTGHPQAVVSKDIPRHDA